MLPPNSRIRNTIVLAIASLLLLGATVLTLVGAQPDTSVIIDGSGNGVYSSPSPNSCRGCIYRSDHGAYEVVVRRDPHDSGKYIAVAKLPDVVDIPELLAFKEANRTLATEVFAKHSEARTLLTFSRLLPYDRFQELMSQPGVKLRQACMLVSENGQAPTIFLPASFSPHDINPQTFKGFYCADTDLTAAAYTNLSNSPDVYLLDVTDTLVREELGDRYKPLEVQAEYAPFFLMQDMGLVKKK